MLELRGSSWVRLSHPLMHVSKIATVTPVLLEREGTYTEEPDTSVAERLTPGRRARRMDQRDPAVGTSVNREASRGVR